MSGLQLNVGLFSGINYVDLVDQLIKLDGITKDNLVARTERLQLEKNALSELMSRFLLSSYMIRGLNSVTPFRATAVSSSNESLIKVTKTGTPVIGSYTFTPLQMASSQQTVAKGVASDTDALGKTGTITLGKGWSVENEVQLADINGGMGFSKGSIRITDANGFRATIDLRKAVTVNDVINAINENQDVDVIAELDGDKIMLRDVSGAADLSKFAVQEVSGGNTAASLGLIGGSSTIDPSTGVLTGSRIWYLGENMSLDLLNDGNGLVFDNIAWDFSISCKDGTTVVVDFSKLSTSEQVEAGAPQNRKELTVGDLLKTINESSNGKVTARISDDGKGFVLEDHTVGNGVTSILQGGATSPILKMLGFVDGNLDRSASVLDGLTSLTRSAKMEIEYGVNQTAVLELTDNDIASITLAMGTGSNVYAAFADRLNQKLDEAGITEIEFRVNAPGSAGDGLNVLDKSGDGIKISDYGDSDLATRLGLTGKEVADTIAAFAGVTPGTIRITDQVGNSAEIEITQSEFSGIKTAAQLAALFNDKLVGTDVEIEFDVNVGGNALTFKDTSGGTENRTSFVDVTGNLIGRLGLAESTDIGNVLSGVTPGTITFTDKAGIPTDITLSQSDLDGVQTLSDLIGLLNDKFNAEGIGINAIMNGAGNGIRFNNSLDGNGATFTMDIADGTSNLASLLGIAGATEEVAWNTSMSGVTPGEIKFTDQDGTETVIEITQTDLDGIATIEDLETLFADKLTGTNIGVGLNAMGTRLVFTDTSGGGGSFTVEAVGDTNIVSRLGISKKSGDAAEEISSGVLVHHRIVSPPFIQQEFTSIAIEEEPILQGTTNKLGTLETRNLIGGLDTVTLSTLNGGNGIQIQPGVLEVQDRAGNTADIIFTAADVNSIKTLSDAVKVYNAKLSDAGIGIEVRINDTKTGLEIVDKTGSTANNLIFRDKTTSTTIPGSPAIPAVPGVDAVSGDNGTGGTAVLTFDETHWMNGFTFGFTDILLDAGYNSVGQKFTFYLDPAIQSEPSATQDEMVQAAINAQIASVWTSVFPPSLFGDVAPPTAKLTTGLAAQAFDDVISGGETEINEGAGFGTDGVTHVPEVPAVPDEVITSNGSLASAFGLNINTANQWASGTSLSRQIISYNTPLSDLNAGAGVNLAGGRFTITDSLGNSQIVVIDAQKHKTVGDIIDAINRLTSVSVTASINATGDGITIEEYGGGTGTFSIYDSDSTSKLAESLGIVGSVSASQRDADGRGRISMSVTHQIEVEETDSLDTIRQKINDLNAGYTASILVDGSNTPFRLSVSGKQTGAAGGFNLDLSAIGLTTENMSEAKDAMIAYGDVNTSNALVLTSSTNTFKGIINGMDLTITGVSDAPVTITSESSSMDVKVRLQSFVDNYNSFREYLNKQMNYSINSNGQILVAEDGGTLWNSSIAKAFDREVNDLLLKRVEGIPGIYSLADLGITVRKNYDDVAEGIGSNTGTNTLVFDEDKFLAAWEKNPEAVQKFFFDEREHVGSDGKTTTVNYGWAQKFSDLTDSLCGRADALGKVQARIDTLTETIDRNDQRVAYLEERLEWKRQMYLNQFYAMEQALARMSNDMSAVSNIATAWTQNYSSGTAY